MNHSLPNLSAPRAAYIHVPFCRHHCGYCNFTVVAGRDDLIGDFLRALDMELATLGEPPQIDTLFFGGGTPTHLAPEQLAELLAIVSRRFVLSAEGEFSVEANPADLTADKVAVLVAGGVNRISLGAQSFATERLQLLERDHTADHIARAVELCRAQAGAQSARPMRVSLDLIFAVPGQSLDHWYDDLRQALALEPDHLSTYGLTIERGTRFFNQQLHGQLVEVDEETQRAMYLGAIERLTTRGWEHYEVSNFARPGCRCRHNEVYWAGESYYAAGPGAARYVDGVRETNHRSTTTWLRRVLAGESPVAEREQLAPEDRAREALVFGLRRITGWNRDEFAARFGYSIDALGGAALQRYIEAGLILDDDMSVRLSASGLPISDALWPALLAGG